MPRPRSVSKSPSSNARRRPTRPSPRNRRMRSSSSGDSRPSPPRRPRRSPRRSPRRRSPRRSPPRRPIPVRKDENGRIRPNSSSRSSSSTGSSRSGSSSNSSSVSSSSRSVSRTPPKRVLKNKSPKRLSPRKSERKPKSLINDKRPEIRRSPIGSDKKLNIDRPKIQERVEKPGRRSPKIISRFHDKKSVSLSPNRSLPRNTDRNKFTKPDSRKETDLRITKSPVRTRFEPKPDLRSEKYLDKKEYNEYKDAIISKMTRTKEKEIIDKNDKYKEKVSTKDKENEEKIPQTTIHISHITRNVRECHLREIFEVYGKVVDIELPLIEDFNLPRGYAKIKYLTTEEAKLAHEHMNGGQIDGQMVSVDLINDTAIRKRSVSPEKKRAVSPKRRRSSSSPVSHRRR